MDVFINSSWPQLHRTHDHRRGYTRHHYHHGHRLGVRCCWLNFARLTRRTRAAVLRKRSVCYRRDSRGAYKIRSVTMPYRWTTGACTTRTSIRFFRYSTNGKRRTGFVDRSDETDFPTTTRTGARDETWRKCRKSSIRTIRGQYCRKGSTELIILLFHSIRFFDTKRMAITLRKTRLVVYHRIVIR